MGIILKKFEHTMNQKVGIVIPSYNEAKNISILVKKIFAALPKATVLIVDDSREEENKKLKTLLRSAMMKNKKNLICISRFKKSGRGSAVILGLEKMLQDPSIQYFFEMDADLAHDPKDFEKFFKAIVTQNADVVIGSRYLQKSKIVKWPLWRLVLSRLYNIIINMWLGLKLSDYTNGFRLYKKGAIVFLTKVRLKEKGFITLSEIAYRLKSNNFKLVEIPITFTDRKHGTSNANLREYLSALIGIIRIKILPIQYK